MTNVYLVLLSVGSSLGGLDPAWIALVGTIMGGVGLKTVEHFLAKNKVKVDDATQIRSELRSEVTELRKEIRGLEQDRDRWREKYYEVWERFINRGGADPPDMV